MYALFAALIAIAVVTMMWRYLERETRAGDDDDGDLQARRPRPALPRRTPKTRTVAPDDDPDFLRELGKRIHKDPNDEPRPGSE
ncbi:MAG: hypothetical protein ACK5MR_06365 [Cumulibacter sp.]